MNWVLELTCCEPTSLSHVAFSYLQEDGGQQLVDWDTFTDDVRDNGDGTYTHTIREAEYDCETGRYVPVSDNAPANVVARVKTEDQWLCPFCGEASPESEWEEGEAYCETCTTHFTDICPRCKQPCDSTLNHPKVVEPARQVIPEK